MSGPLLLKGLALYLANLLYLWKSRNSGLRKWDLAQALHCGMGHSAQMTRTLAQDTHTPPPKQTLYGVTLRLPLETPPCSPVERCTRHSWTRGQRQRQPQSTALSSCSPVRAHGCSEKPASPGKRVAPFVAGFLAIFYKPFRPILNL